MNKLQKIGVFTLCAVSFLSVGVGALTHSNNYDRVKVSANNTNENYYLKDMVYVNDSYNDSIETFIDTYLLSYYSNNNYNLRYLSLQTTDGNTLEYAFGENYTPFKIDYVEFNPTSFQLELWVMSIDGDNDFHDYGIGTTLKSYSIGYNDNVIYDGLFNVNNTTLMYSYYYSGGFDLTLPNYYYYDYGAYFTMKIKYDVDWNNETYTTMIFNSNSIQIGNLLFENRKILDNGKVCFLLVDYNYRDLSSINDFLPYEIHISFILQNEYDFLVKPKQDKVFYLSKWFLDANVLNAPSSSQIINMYADNPVLKINDTYYDYIRVYYYDLTESYEPYNHNYHKSINLGYFNGDLAHSYSAITLYEYQTVMHTDFTYSDTTAIWNNLPIEIVDSYDSYYKLMGTYLLPFKSNVSANIGTPTNGNVFIPNADLGGTMSLFGTAFNGVAGFLSIEILPNISLWILLMLPFFVTLLIFIVKLFKR